MTSLLNPYLSFPGTARAAVDFYAQVLGGTPQISTFGEFGQEGADADKVMHARLETDLGFTLMLSDFPPGMEPVVGNTFAVSLSGDDAADLRRYWEQLSAAGSVQLPLEKQMWGDEFGMCIDQFGVQWMVNIAQPTG